MGMLKGAQAVLWLILLLGFSGCSLIPAPTPPSSTQYPPIYPGAQQVQTQILSTYAGPYNDKHISFQTTDRPEDVLAFYRTTLSKDGWQPPPVSAPSNTLFMGWVDGSANPAFRLEIVMKSTTNGVIQVELTLNVEPPL